MSRIASSYSVSSPTRVCAATGCLLRTGDPFVSALCQDVQTEEFRRADYSIDAWEGGARPGSPLELIGTWRGTVPDPNEKRKLLLDEGSLLDLFEQTADAVAGATAETNRRREVFRFVLALILIRKRLLVCEKSTWGNGTASVMLVRPKGVPRPPEGPALIEVADPGMSDADVAAVIEQLQSILVDSGTEPQAGATGSAT
jgi:hypothetical protein